MNHDELLKNLETPSCLGAVISSADFKIGDKVVIMNNYSRNFGYKGIIIKIIDDSRIVDVDGDTERQNWQMLKHCL